MGKRISTRIKIGGIIVLFSVLVTALFVVSMLWFGKTVQNMEPTQKSVYLTTAEDYLNLFNDPRFVSANPENVMTIADYNSQFQREVLKKLLPISGSFLLLFVSLCFWLWKAITHMQNKKMLQDADLLALGKEEDLSVSNPAVLSVYHTLHQRFENLLDDNKRLYAYLSHEQKNAIAVLRTSLELSGCVEYLDAMDELSNGIDDILTLSETASTAATVPIDVSLVCAEVYDRYKKIYEHLTFDFEGDSDTEIMAKSRWIYRAVSNLLDNAIKYGCDKPIDLSVSVKKGSVIVKVQDHGIGIDETQLEKIFQDRYRINELNKNGYGIGLSLVSYVCDLCGGFILAESEPAHGTTFYLSFPQKAG